MTLRLMIAQESRQVKCFIAKRLFIERVQCSLVRALYDMLAKNVFLSTLTIPNNMSACQLSGVCAVDLHIKQTSLIQRQNVQKEHIVQANM